MSYDPETDDLLVRRALKLGTSRPNEPIADQDEFDELLALHLEGQLTGDDEQLFLRTLEANPQARAIFADYGAMLTTSLDESVVPLDETASCLPNKTASTFASRRDRSTIRRLVSLAIAACLLVVLGILYFPGSHVTESVAFNDAVRLLQEGRFEEVLQTLDQAEKNDVWSPRLQNLKAAATAEMPVPEAPADAFTLSAFGYGYDGTTPRSLSDADGESHLERAEAMLQDVESDVAAARLNRGYLLLRLGRADEAVRVFRGATESDATSTSAWIGLGAAYHVSGDLNAAIETYRSILERDPNSIPARINLAIALLNESRREGLDEAIELYSDLLQDNRVPQEQRIEIERAVQQIEQMLDDEGEPQSPAAAASPGTTYALVIGVNSCPEFRVSRRSTVALLGAENDAKDVGELLQSDLGVPKDNITVLLGPEATYEAIAMAFEHFAGRVGRQDQFVFHFSGHGTQIEDGPEPPNNDEREVGLDEALCPFDAHENGQNLLRDDQLARLIRRIDAKTVTLFLDCCHSGDGRKGNGEWRVRSLGIAERSASDGAPFRELTASSKRIGRRVVALYACASSQSAYEGPCPERGRTAGLFTRYLVAGLTGGQSAPADANRDDTISVHELTSFIERKIDETFNRGRPESQHQNPWADAAAPDEPLFDYPARLSGT